MAIYNLHVFIHAGLRVNGVTYLAGSWGDDGLDSLYSLDLGTGAATYLTGLEGITHDISGLFFSEAHLPVPVPAAFWLLGSGLLCLAVKGRRSR